MYFVVIEIGSNAIRMILASYDSDNQLKILDRWSAHLRLGAFVFDSGNIPEYQIEKLARILQHLKTELKGYFDIQIGIFATSAMRDASNRFQVTECISEATGFSVEILSGQEEALVLLNGLSAFLPLSAKTYVHADLGGGSLELNGLQSNLNAETPAVIFQDSIDIGTLRLKQEALKTGDLFQLLNDKLIPFINHINQSLQALPSLIFTGGNAKILARILPQLSTHVESDSSKNIQWIKFDWLEFERIEKILQQQSVEQQMKEWGLREQQAENFNLALQVFKVIGQTLNSTDVSIPFFGLKESLLLRMLKHENSMTQNYPKLVLTSGHPKKVQI